MVAQPRVIFVFGSNLAGHHAGGAALDAKRFWGALPGVGVGPTGEAYALPTMDEDLERLTLAEIGHHAREFCAYADAHLAETFYVTPVGCGIAGFTEADIAPLFESAPANVQLPAGWRPCRLTLIDESNYGTSTEHVTRVTRADTAETARHA